MTSILGHRFQITESGQLLGGYRIESLDIHLQPLIDEGLLGDTELQLVDLLGSLVGETSPVPLALLALAIRAPRIGHVCVDFNELLDAERRALMVLMSLDGHGDVDTTTVEAVASKLEAALLDSPLTRQELGSASVAVLDGRLFYLHRMWMEELHVFNQLSNAMTEVPRALNAAELVALDKFFEPGETDEIDYQRLGAERALTSRLTLISGGPGTGKTRTVARTLCALLQAHPQDEEPLVVRLAAPTGKAASRLAEAIQSEVQTAGLDELLTEQLFAIEPVTIHRLLQMKHDGTFQRNTANPVHADVVVIDESSMVSLSIMNSLLDAIDPSTRLILVGDPYQLASVDAGAVFGDIVRGVSASSSAEGASSLVVLQRTHRFSSESVTAQLAAAVVQGNSTEALSILGDHGEHSTTEVRWLPDEGAMGPQGISSSLIGQEAIKHAKVVIEAALEQRTHDALHELAGFKLLCGTRHGERGMHAWNRAIEAALKKEYRDLIRGEWYVGRPVIMNRNDYQLNLFNGEVGVTVATDDGVKVAFQDDDDIRLIDPILLTDVESQWAMTIHKSQGSEYRHAVVILPEPPSQILTRELLYTGLTRAKPQVTIAASATSVQLSIDTPVRRASGLTRRFTTQLH